MSIRLLPASSGRGRAGKLDARIARDDLGHAARHQQQGIAVGLAAHQRDGLALKASHFSIGENRLETVAYFHTRAVILNCVQDQDATIGGLGPDSPFLEKIHSVGLDIGAVKRFDRHHRDLCVRFFLDLAAEIGQLRDSVLVKNMGEIVDVARRLELDYFFAQSCLKPAAMQREQLATILWANAFERKLYRTYG